MIRSSVHIYRVIVAVLSFQNHHYHLLKSALGSILLWQRNSNSVPLLFIVHLLHMMLIMALHPFCELPCGTLLSAKWIRLVSLTCVWMILMSLSLQPPSAKVLLASVQAPPNPRNAQQERSASSMYINACACVLSKLYIVNNCTQCSIMMLSCPMECYIFYNIFAQSSNVHLYTS